MALEVGSGMPSFAAATAWIGDPVTSSDVSGQATLVHFWAISCPICKLGMCQLKEWKREFPVMRFIAVHMPRQETDMCEDSVRAAVAEIGMSEVCAIDNSHAVGEAFQTSGVWPCYFLYDSNATLRRRGVGSNGLGLLHGPALRLAGGADGHVISESD